ncbi:unnamed protein product [Nyctereutes procyonoides]|uniref:(raccoon dog) hypothetical protein n=1 Tax=Nyctereutes procyonoides TaxID=34880 RepID=A0A811ZPR4_NYCPR|nr:unnamed protein product [Nyctereutes procyonoides]
MPLVHSSHSCTICRQPTSPPRAPPSPGHTHLPIAAPRAAAAPPLPAPAAVALSRAESRPRRSSPRFPAGGGGTPEPPGLGAPQLRFNSWQAQGGTGEAPGWGPRRGERGLRRRGRGARRPGR